MLNEKYIQAPFVHTLPTNPLNVSQNYVPTEELLVMKRLQERLRQHMLVYNNILNDLTGGICLCSYDMSMLVQI